MWIIASLNVVPLEQYLPYLFVMPKTLCLIILLDFCVPFLFSLHMCMGYTTVAITSEIKSMEKNKK